MTLRRGWWHTPPVLRARVGIAEHRFDDGGTDNRRLGRDVALAACAVVLSVASAIHVALYPRTFNTPAPAPALMAQEPVSPPSRPEPDPGAARPRLAFVVVDGLRDDAAAILGLEGAPARDGAPPPLALCTLEASWPSFSIPGYVAMATGVPPALSGVHNNWHRGPIGLDTVFAQARLAGRSVCAAGDETDDWGRLFPEDLGVQTTGPRAFAIAIHDLFLDGAPACDLTLVHTVIVDDAAHVSGAASNPYARAVAATGSWLRATIGRMDPARDTLVVTSDHGHIDRGGHGGTEPEVLRVPLFVIGRGASREPAPDGCAGGRLIDVAPTVAVLAGAEPPRQSVGTVLRPLLSLDPSALDAADAAGRRTRAAVAAAIDRADGDPAAGGPGRPRLWTGLLGLAAAAALGWMLLLIAGPAAGGLRSWATPALYPVLAWSILLLLEPGATFSAKQNDWPEYGLRIFLLLSIPAITAFGSLILAFSQADPDAARRTRAVALAGAAASWPIVVGLHGSPFGAPLGEPHLSFAVVLAGLVASVGCGYLALILALDAALAWLGAGRPARTWAEGAAIARQTLARLYGSR